MAAVDATAGAAEDSARPTYAGNMLIRRLKISGMLSFGQEGIDLPMEPLTCSSGPTGRASPTSSKHWLCCRRRRGICPHR